MHARKPNDSRRTGRNEAISLCAIVGAAGGSRTANLSTDFDGVASLASASQRHVSFASHRRYLNALRQTQAGAVIVSNDLAGEVPAHSISILCDRPDIAWSLVAALSHPTPPVAQGIHPTAWVDPAASIDPSAEIGPLCVIHNGAEIGARCRLGSGVVIGSASSSGRTAGSSRGQA